MTKISVIVITLNSTKFIDPCLGSLFAQEFKDFEAIVVDNGSTDGTVGMIERNFPQVKLMKNSENLGPSRARNQGIMTSQGEWVLVLDCDLILANDFLMKTSELLRKVAPEVGMLQPKILSTDHKKIYSCGIYFSYLMRFYDMGMGKKETGVFNKPRNVFGACSAAAFYRRKMLEEIKEPAGYFDERFFFLAEDVDLSWRAQNKGWKALFNPDLVCFHEGNSSNTKKEVRQYLCFRNRLFAIIKNERSLIRRAFSLVIYDIPRIIYLIFVNRLIFKALKEIFNFSRELNSQPDYNPPNQGNFRQEERKPREVR